MQLHFSCLWHFNYKTNLPIIYSPDTYQPYQMQFRCYFFLFPLTGNFRHRLFQALGFILLFRCVFIWTVNVLCLNDILLDVIYLFCFIYIFQTNKKISHLQNNKSITQKRRNDLVMLTIKSYVHICTWKNIIMVTSMYTQQNFLKQNHNQYEIRVIRLRNTFWT